MDSPAQIEHTDLLRRARHATAQAALAAGDARAAVAAAEAAVRADPLDEVAYRALLNALNSAGEPARALTAYERLRRTLARQLGVDPATATRQLTCRSCGQCACQPARGICPMASEAHILGEQDQPRSPTGTRCQGLN